MARRASRIARASLIHRDPRRDVDDGDDSEHQDISKQRSVDAKAEPQESKSDDELDHRAHEREIAEPMDASRRLEESDNRALNRRNEDMDGEEDE